MNNKVVFITVLYVFFTFLFLHSKVHSQEDFDGYQINNIKFSGNESFSRKKILNQISIRGTNFLHKYILRKKVYHYNEKLLEASLESIKRFYQREGFLYVNTAKKELIPNHKKKQIDLLTIKIDEGEPIIVGNIHYNIEFNPEDNSHTSKSFRDKIIKSRILNPDSRFRDEFFQLDKEKIINIFKKQGYAFVNVDHSLELLESENKVDIDWQIKTGKKYFFGSTSVKGNKNIPQKFILKQLPYDDSTLFSRKLIGKAQNNIYDLGLFQIVNVKGKYELNNGNKIPVEIYVKESPRFNAKIGIGYGSEDKFRIFMDLRRINLFGRSRIAELSVKHSALEPYNLNFKYIQPQFFSSITTMIINPYLRHEIEPGYETLRKGLNLPFTFHFTNRIKSSLNFYLEKVRNKIEDDSTNIITPAGKNLYDKSGILLNNEWSTSQPIFYPQEGFFASLSCKINGYIFNSHFKYTRLLLDFRKYQLIYNSILAVRFEIGGIESQSSNGFVPVEDRFFAGGSMSIRGWSRSDVGPHANGKPIGGKSIMETSVELRYPIYNNLSGTVFMDMGNVWENSYNYDLTELRYSAGLGLRYKTPIGPIRLDIARPIWNHEKTIQFHINIGQAF
ncbi:MAG: BamA/TamA family outer membrane protein [Candidatus Cloacimonetes bacterium]|nr:BamA/TamA family outer membrane protein [Candidatus Cloacimonadota bacterium]